MYIGGIAGFSARFSSPIRGPQGVWSHLRTRGNYEPMLSLIRSVTSVAILAWAGMMILLGFAQGEAMWVVVGLAIGGVGIPLLASNPLAANLLYPSKGQPEAD